MILCDALVHLHLHLYWSTTSVEVWPCMSRTIVTDGSKVSTEPTHLCLRRIRQIKLVEPFLDLG